MRVAHLTTVHPRIDARIRIKEVGTLANTFAEPVALFVQDGKGDAIEANGAVQVTDIGLSPGRRIVRMIVGNWRMWRAVQSARPRIVHFHDPELIPLGFILKCCGYKVVYDVHEDLPRQVLSKYWLPAVTRRPISWVMSIIEWLATRVFDAIVPATPKIAERFPPHKTTIVQNFPILSELITSKGIPYTERPPHFAYIGAITNIRGIHKVVNAMSHAGQIGGKDIQLQLAGPFQPASLQSEVSVLAGWQRIDYLGWVNRQRVAEILGNALAGLVLFLPAPNHMDAYPNKMFEYMSASLPVIASDFPLWRHIIGDARCGLLVDPQDPQAIADAMLWVANHPAEAEAMGRRGRDAVEQYYNWDSESDKLINLYNTLLPD